MNRYAALAGLSAAGGVAGGAMLGSGAAAATSVGPGAGQDIDSIGAGLVKAGATVIAFGGCLGGIIAPLAGSYCLEQAGVGSRARTVATIGMYGAAVGATVLGGVLTSTHLGS